MTALLDRLRSGDRRLLARAATAIERAEPGIERLADALYRAAGAAHVVGITGPPGAGKSTLVDALIAEYRLRGRRVGVVAIDPTSPLTGGATLGDRYRMMRHHADPDVFIRSMANRGLPGGLAPTAHDIVQLLDVARYDVVIVETVGIGQSDTAVATLADTTVLVQVPGAGDSLQALKAGVLELGDILAVTKGDLPGARDVARDLRAMLSLAAADGPATTPVILTSSVFGDGIATLVDAVERHRDALATAPSPGERRAMQVRALVASHLQAALSSSTPGGPLPYRTVADLVARRVSPRQVADELLTGRG